MRCAYGVYVYKLTILYIIYITPFSRSWQDVPFAGGMTHSRNAKVCWQQAPLRKKGFALQKETKANWNDHSKTPLVGVEGGARWASGHLTVTHQVITSSLLFPVPDKMSHLLEEWLTAETPRFVDSRHHSGKRDLHCKKKPRQTEMTTPTIPRSEHFDLSTENQEANLGQQH